MKVLKQIGLVAALPVILIALWWVVTLQPTSFFIPRPQAVFEKFVTVWLGELLTSDIAPSVLRLLLGLLISIIIGVVLGLIIGSVRWFYWATEPLLEFIRAVPATILIPILLLIVGINEQTRTVVVVFGCVWPILLNTIAGVHSIDEVLKDTARVYRIEGWAKVRYLLIRGASPQIMAGIRQSLAIGLILIVVSEMFAAATNGIGYQLAYFQGRLKVPEMWAGILILSVLGALLGIAFQLAEKFVLRWYHGLKEGMNNG